MAESELPGFSVRAGRTDRVWLSHACGWEELSAGPALDLGRMVRDARRHLDACPGIVRTSHGQCASCRTPFDPGDTRWDGGGRYQNTIWCRRCVDRCQDNEDAGHACRVCRDLEAPRG